MIFRLLMNMDRSYIGYIVEIKIYHILCDISFLIKLILNFETEYKCHVLFK
jgi:hypothetical protein